jgi:hypothetical protein
VQTFASRAVAQELALGSGLDLPPHQRAFLIPLDRHRLVLRKIVAWGLFPEITRFEVVAVITNAVAAEGIDELPEGAMLQEQYGSEAEARSRIGAAIWDYNFRRPNAGNGGFAPNSVHIQGRSALTKRRKEARQHTENRRRNHWDQIQPC